MSPRKAAKTSGKGITSSSRNPLDKLPVYKRRFVKARVEGKDLDTSCSEAGVGRTQGRRYEKEADVQAAYRHLMRLALPAQKLVNLIKGGCEAKMPVYGSDGKKRAERADWKTRKPYIEMASKQSGYYEDRSEKGGSGVSINVSVNHIGQPSLGPPVGVKVVEGQMNNGN